MDELHPDGTIRPAPKITVTRKNVDLGGGVTASDVDPPFDESWDDLTKLRWHAAVVAHDTGLAVTAEAVPGGYAVRIRGHGGSKDTGRPGRSFGWAWDYLNAFRDGYGYGHAAAMQEGERGH